MDSEKMKTEQNEKYKKIIDNSLFDIDLLTKAIYDSREEPTLDKAYIQRITPYTCKICGFLGENGDTNIPLICQKCARKLAISIIVDGSPMLKLQRKEVTGNDIEEIRRFMMQKIEDKLRQKK